VKHLASCLILLLLAATVFSLATILQPRSEQWSRRGSDNVLNLLFGDGRKLFANHFFIKADVSFHSGYYPSIFDHVQAPKDSRHMQAHEGTPEAEEHEKQMSFLGPPRDWIERFGRHFMITDHTHLGGTTEREILPWLKISAELDPQRIDTYTVAAYWLRDVGKLKEAEQFLREGLRNNPDSYEILFQLGQLYRENYHETARARDLWELALAKWNQHESRKKDPDRLGLEQIAVNLGRLEENEGHFDKAIALLTIAKSASPNAAALQDQIEQLKSKNHANKK
jgi:tetratricopeptide (TPR) repeat protein